MKNEDYLLEYEILGSFLNDESTQDFIDNLSEDDFLDSNCKILFDGMKDLRRKSNDINIYTIANLKKASISDITKISSSVVTTSNIESKIKVLKDKSNRRKIIQKLNIAQGMALDTSIDINELQNNILQEIQELETVVDEGYSSLEDTMHETIELLNKRYKNKDDHSFLTGITKFDNYTAGLHPEELTTIGARPGVGKTILGMQIGLKVARNKRKVIYTSLEMSNTSLGERIISSEVNIDYLRLRTGNISDKEWKPIEQVALRNSLKNFIIDKSSRNPQHIRTKLRKLKPDLLIIDYLQLLQSNQKEQSREREVATITRDLKLMALEFKIPIIILSQLNRNAEGNRPSMADLRESGAIEQDSDNIIFIHEPSKKEKEKLINDGVYSEGFFKNLEARDRKFSSLIIEKQRNGPVGTIDVIRVPELMKFIEIS